ncbi:MAG TPA: hypothetical protein VJU86_06535 [Pyrinomonadaceae bacterium]|nr:hypothetical protein [Pyrinomonadaceae bacterium]
MNHLFSMAFLLLILAPQDQKLPDAFHQIPEETRVKATVIVTGTYVRGRGPCMFMPDGSRRWPLQAWFRIKKVYRGEVGGKSIPIKSTLSPKAEAASVKLEVEREYLVLLRPSEESMKAIKAGDHIPAWDAPDGEEIVAIVELK